jgi:hypothetical protein
MIIALCALALASFLSLGGSYDSDLPLHVFNFHAVIRWMLVRENKRMEREEINLMHGPERQRIEQAARLEGITFEEAIKRRKGFRYLY